MQLVLTGRGCIGHWVRLGTRAVAKDALSRPILLAGRGRCIQASRGRKRKRWSEASSR